MAKRKSQRETLASEKSDDQQRINPVVRAKRELADKIQLLIAKSPPDYFQMTIPHNHDGSPKGPIVVNSHQYMPSIGDFMTTKWLTDEVRELWRQSAEFVPGARIVDSESDAGFTLWLWSNSQRAWTVSLEMGYAINPFTMWLSGISTGCAGERIVNSNPRLATAVEISYVAECAKRLATVIPQTNTLLLSQKEWLKKCQSELIQTKRAVSERDQSESLTPQEWPSRLSQAERRLAESVQAYRQFYLDELRFKQWFDVVRLYAGAFAKELSAEFSLLVNLENLWPGHTVISDEVRVFLDLVAVELSDFASTMATNRIIAVSSSGISDDTLMSVNDIAGILLDVSAKTLCNYDVKTWGPHHATINRERVWRWGDIKVIVTKRRKLKPS